MAIAQSTLPTDKKSQKRRRRETTPNPHLDFAAVRRSAKKLLSQNLLPYQHRLNSKLLSQLFIAFQDWLAEFELEIVSQLEHVPDHAKEKWLQDRIGLHDRRQVENQTVRLLTDFLFQFTQLRLLELKRLGMENQQFRNTIAKVQSESARRKIILQYAATLGASAEQLKGDEKAFDRWFDEEAVTDRFAKRVGEIELLLAFTFERISVVVDQVFAMIYRNNNELNNQSSEDDFEDLVERLTGAWQRLSIESRLHDAIHYEGDSRVCVAALKCLGAAMCRLPENLGDELIDKRTHILLLRTIVEARTDVWVQCESITNLASLSMQRVTPLLIQRLSNPIDGDDMFVRRHILKLFSSVMLKNRNRDLQLPKVDGEPSAFVRQAFAKTAFLSTNEDTRRQWAQIALHDEVLQVRAAALLVGVEVDCSINDLIDYLQVIVKVLQDDTDPFVLRTAMHVVVTVMGQVTASAGQSPSAIDDIDENEVRRETVHAFYHQRILPRLIRLQRSHESVPVRRWASQIREQCWAITDSDARELLSKIAAATAVVATGQSKRLPKKWFAGFSDDKLGRVFAVLSQDDFGYDIDRGTFGVHITRGPAFGFRLWRLIFEFTHTATDKRQALRHTVGRINTSAMRAPSQICGELSETKVPGEPLTIANDGTWRPFVPLADDFVSVLNRSWFFSRTTTFYTSQGITRVTGPEWFHRRLITAWKLNFRFAQYAVKRNWDDDTYPASTFVNEMRGLGFQIEFDEYDDVDSQIDETNSETNGENAEQDDNTVSRFFTSTLCAAPVLALNLVEPVKNYFTRFAEYFESAYENSIEELVVFAVVLTAIVFAKHFYANYSFRKARRNIPLSIGGWGTRGKSGTERLKAALIGGMGHGLVSKTTGCEAMFIHADPNGEPLEIPLFRPFDKATIWEQHNLIMMASHMNPSVFLWECMALTPSYVDVLQRQWTCDDLGTITNTYPDHEDVQGPAGHDVATTISGFVPIKSYLLTTEQQMRPYVTESCRKAGTTLHGIGWLESGLVTDDVLDRFPYKEHPDNVALVAAMGEQLGVEYDFSLKAMGDYLVPDLGVLKTHPVSTVRTRKIEFTNGMSANERFGCMGNLKRLGFDTQDPWTEPTTWVSGVVNNRADRVPRSKVFAKIIVEDMNADRFFLIGSNLNGLRSFIDDAWTEKASTISLRDQGQPYEKEFALETLQKAAWSYRQPIEQQHVQSKLSVMLTAAFESLDLPAQSIDALISDWENPDQLRQQLQKMKFAPEMIESIFKHHSQAVAGFNDYHQILEKINNAPASEAEKIEEQYIAMLRGWYMQKLVVVENFDATGEDVVRTVVNETPPGFLNRTIGLQNIKGTGLDFVYRFQAWDFCYEACEAALSSKPKVAERGLQSLMAMPAIGQLCQQRVGEVIREARVSNVLRRPDLQAQVSQLETRWKVACDDAPSDLSDSDSNGETGADSANDVQPDGQNAQPKETSTAASRAASLAKWNKWMLQTSEQFADLGDSVRRRDTADRIYKDLAAQRISRQRAVVELRKINKRQKGGWLATALSKK